MIIRWIKGDEKGSMDIPQIPDNAIILYGKGEYLYKDVPESAYEIVQTLVDQCGTPEMTSRYHYPVAIVPYRLIVIAREILEDIERKRKENK